MNHTSIFLLLVCLMAAPASAQQETDDVLDEREAQQKNAIRDARADYLARVMREEAACYQRFAVNDCLLKIRAAKRDVMADLRRQEILINDTQRKRRAAEQLLRTDERLSGQR